MPANTGKNPFLGNPDPPKIDIQYKGGCIARYIDPNQRDWRKFGGAWEIASWQPTTAKGYELCWGSENK